MCDQILIFFQFLTFPVQCCHRHTKDYCDSNCRWILPALKRNRQQIESHQNTQAHVDGQLNGFDGQRHFSLHWVTIFRHPSVFLLISPCRTESCAFDKMSGFHSPFLHLFNRIQSIHSWLCSHIFDSQLFDNRQTALAVILAVLLA